MTPNPKNIGAAPEEYPIRARVKPEGSQYYWPSMRAMVGGIHDFMRHESGSYYCRNGWAWAPTNLEIISDAAGVPEPQAKGPSPSEVPQPGEGVDLEVTVMFRDNGDAAWWSVIEVPAAGQFKDGEMFRATLRRESK